MHRTQVFRCLDVRLLRRPGSCLLVLTAFVVLVLCINNTTFWWNGRALAQPHSCSCYNKHINDSYDTQTAILSESVSLGHGMASLSGGFIFHAHAWPALNPPDSKICLSTFSSVNRLYWLPWLLQAWSGPISVAVYTPGVDYAVLSKVMQYLRKCYPLLELRVAFHVLYPKNQRPLEMTSDFDISEYNCFYHEESVRQIFDNFRISSDITSVKLPQNHLRNLARRSCDAPFSLVADIDMIPSPLMFERFDLLLHGNIQCKKCALIVPVYEIDSEEKFLPANKIALLQMLFEQKAQRYHVKVYDKNQGNSNLKQWEKANQIDKEEVIFWSLFEDFNENSSVFEALRNYKEVPYREMYKIRGYEEFWEPIVVLPEDAPSFDERFLGFGFCRSSLIYELHQRGFSFRMLDEPFLSHWGFQTTSHYPRHRIMEIKENTVRYDAMKRELQARYSITSSSQQQQKRAPSKVVQTVRQAPPPLLIIGQAVG
uniref:Beta-1,4-glucuronyltransferase 1 n=1 Tax=Hirondellea gigas TaxID=1518452 RepID=A0A2P2IB26_9CRUS